MLTVKQERFAQLLAIADISRTAAYIDAGYSPTQLRKILWEKASVLAHKDKVRARVEQVRATARDKGVITLQKHLSDLDDIGKAATAQDNPTKNFGAAVHAEVCRGKAAGLYVERRRNEPPGDISPEDAVRDLCTTDGVLRRKAYDLGMAMLAELRSPTPLHPVKDFD